MAELDFYQKDMEKIQKKLLNKIEKVLAGLEVLDDAGLAQAFREIDFVDDLTKLGFPALLEKVKGSYDKQVVTAITGLGAAQRSKQTVAAVQAIEVLALLDLSTISSGVTRYANELKTAMFRGLLTGASSKSIMEGLTATYGVGKVLSSKQQVALLNDSFARFARTTTAKLFEDVPEQKFEYVGPLDEVTRDVCVATLEMQGEGMTMAEIEAEAPVSFADGGGFNCRHEWIPV
jgi:hypothetical protein|tara:strand:- start:477 stop:1175 length:699 start_codon:yes stop_codon:yes gene_type:complete